MKAINILLTLLFLLPATAYLQAQNDAISKYFNKYVEDERFTVIYISPKMFQLFDQMDLNLKDEEVDALMNVVTDLRSLRILTTDINTKEFLSEAMNTINTKEYEVLMTIRNKDKETVHIYVKDSNNSQIINELLLLVGGGEEFVLMSFIGNIHLDKISQLANAMEDEGEEQKGEDKTEKKQ